MMAEPDRTATPVIDWEPYPGERPRSTAILALSAIVIGGAALAFLALGEGAFHPTAIHVALDPAVDGQGLAWHAAPDPVLPPNSLVIGAAALAAGLGFLVASRGPIARALSVGFGLLVVVAGVMLVGPAPLATVPERWGDGLGVADGREPASFFVQYAVSPGEPATFAFSVRNVGPLPVTLLGWADEPLIDGIWSNDLGFRVVGVGSLPRAESERSDGVAPRMATAEVAWPIRLDAGQQIDLVVLGRGGPCAARSNDDPSSSTVVASVRIVYRIASWMRIAIVGLPKAVTVGTTGTACIVQEPIDVP